MTTHFIEAEMDLEASPIEMRSAIEAALQQQGKPVRWAITQVDPDRQVVQVEAVVLRDDETTDAADSKEPQMALVR